MEKNRLVSTWINSSIKNNELEKSVMLEKYGKHFDKMLAPYQAPISSTFLADYKMNNDAHKGQHLLIRDGFFTLPDALASNLDFVHLPSQRKVVIHHHLSSFVPGSCWSHQEIFLFDHVSLLPDPFHGILILSHPHFWLREEHLTLEFFQDFILKNKQSLLKYKKIVFLEDILEHKIFGKVSQLFFKELGMLVEAKTYNQFIYHDNLKRYALCDLGDGHITCDNQLLHAFLRRGACFWIGHKTQSISWAKFYSFSPFHGILIWKRDVSQDSQAHWGAYLPVQDLVTSDDSLPFIEERMKKMSFDVRKNQTHYLKQACFKLAALTKNGSLKKIHRPIVFFQKKFLEILFVPYVGRAGIHWRGSTIEKKELNIFENDLDWNIYLRDQYHDWFLTFFRKVLFIVKHLMPNLDQPEIYIHKEKDYQEELQLFDEYRFWPTLFRTLKKVSKECRKLEQCSNDYDKKKIYNSLFNSMKKLGQEHKKNIPCFFPLVFDLDFYLNSHDWDCSFVKELESHFDRNLYSPYLDLQFNSEGLFEWKAKGETLQFLASVLPDATFSDIDSFRSLRLKYPQLCDVYLLGLSDDWILGRSVYRSLSFKKNKSDREKLVKHLAFLKKDFLAFHNLASENFKRTSLYSKMTKLFQEYDE